MGDLIWLGKVSLRLPLIMTSFRVALCVLALLGGAMAFSDNGEVYPSYCAAALCSLDSGFPYGQTTDETACNEFANSGYPCDWDGTSCNVDPCGNTRSTECGLENGWANFAGCDSSCVSSCTTQPSNCAELASLVTDPCVENCTGVEGVCVLAGQGGATSNDDFPYNCTDDINPYLPVEVQLDTLFDVCECGQLVESCDLDATFSVSDGDNVCGTLQSTIDSLNDSTGCLSACTEQSFDYVKQLYFIPLLAAQTGCTIV